MRILVSRLLACVSAVAVLGWSMSVFGHGAPPHPNNAQTILWEEDGTPDGSSNHNHLFNHSFVNLTDETNHHSHASDSAWHDRTYTIGGFFGHGFITEDITQPRYKFANNGTFVELTANMKTTVNEAFDLWETRAHAVGPNLPGRRTGIDFDNGQTNFEFRIAMTPGLLENRGASGEWITNKDQLKADTAGGVGIGNVWFNDPDTPEADTLGTPILAMDDGDAGISWVTNNGLAGANVPDATGERDFATILLHEAGHVVGLLHTPGNPLDHLMRQDISLQARWIDGNGNNMFDAGEGKTFRMIEADSAFGAAELYTVVPEPTSVLSIALAALALVKRRRRA
jgi:hypothetical protein